MVLVSKFSDNFWGEKLNGFDVLCQNLKHSLNNVKELETYFRECLSIDDAYIRLLTKLTLQTNKYSTNGTLCPLWSPIKELNERLNTSHLQQIQQTNEIIKEIQRYYEDLNKKIKKLRENESPTQQCVQNFQEITQLLTKSKEQYHTVAIEHEKQRRADNPNIQKLEKKLKLLLDDYKANIDKYNSIRNDYERRLNDSFLNFQMSEEIHLKQMRTLIDNYGKMLINHNQNKTQVYQEFYAKIDSLSNDFLMQTFIDNKRTGSERPEPVYFIEPDFSKLPQQQITVNAEIDPIYSSNDGQQLNTTAYQSMNTNYSTHYQTSLNPLSLSSSTSSSNNDSQVLNNTSPMHPNHHHAFTITPTTTGVSSSLQNGTVAGTLASTTTTTIITTIATTTATTPTTSTTTTSTNSTSSTNILNMKRSDSKGFNIFNVDILSLGKKSSKTAKASNSNAKTKKKGSMDQQNQTQFAKIQTPDHSLIQAPQLDLIQINYSNKDDLLQNDNLNQSQNTVRTINSVLGSSSLDLFDQLKSNSTNGSDIDSEGYTIRPEQIKRTSLIKDNADMTNLYNSSSGSNSDSDSEPEPGMGPTKVMLTIKPKEECELNSNDKNTDLLREISKSLQLKPLQSSQSQANNKNKRSNYIFGMTDSNWANNSAGHESLPMSRSMSFAGISTTTTTTTVASDLNLSLRQSTINETHLYNIDEDKEVESSFQHNKRNSESTSSTTPVNQENTTPVSNQPPPLPPLPPLPPMPPSSLANSVAGRFTPACFPGRTTPDFHYTTSFFENSTRAITSPLTLNDNNIIPIAIAFNETMHAYFKLAELTKHKIKCFGCMKISFPFAILKFLAINDLPKLEFKLKNLSLQQQDDALALNKQLLVENPDTEYQYQFNAVNLAKELREQHMSNKLAAFFNFELLKYEFKYADAPPLFLNSKWSYTFTSATQIELDFYLESTMNYKKSHLSNVNYMLSLTQQPSKFKLIVNTSDPKAQVQINNEKIQILWQFLNLTKSNLLNLKLFLNINDLSLITADEAVKFVCEQPLYVKFHIDNQTLSGIKLDILSSNYRLSLVKERIESGKYFCTPFLHCLSPISRANGISETEKQVDGNTEPLTNGEDCKLIENANNLRATSPPVENSVMTF